MVAESPHVLRQFFDAEGRLKQIPVKRAKLLVVLAHLAAAFEPGRRYPERTVNEIIKRFHPDFCTLRRDLVDFRFLGREGGEYWLLDSPPMES
jgi:hypothetical protein